MLNKDEFELIFERVNQIVCTNNFKLTQPSCTLLDESGRHLIDVHVDDVTVSTKTEIPMDTGVELNTNLREMRQSFHIWPGNKMCKVRPHRYIRCIE